MNTKSQLARLRLWALLALTCLVVPVLWAVPPDLTNGGVPDPNTFPEQPNLGPTGLRGWMYHAGADSGESRQILVTKVDVGSPAASVMASNDVILGVSGTGDEPTYFSSDARKSFGYAIADAEARNPATMKLIRWRAGSTTTVQITLRTMGAYSATAPYNCPKSAKILEESLQYFMNNETSGRGSFGALGLLAANDPSNPSNAVRQARAQTDVLALIPTADVIAQLKSDVRDDSYQATWTRGPTLILLAEYYLKTGDAQVLPAIEAYALNIAKNLSHIGTCGHRYADRNPDGSNGPMGGHYGAVNSAGMPCFLGLILAQKCGLTNPEIAPMIKRGSAFYAAYVNKGVIPYGEHMPGETSHENNGKSGLGALVFMLQTNRLVEAKFFAKCATAAATEREIGHLGSYFNYTYAPLGAAAGGEAAAAAYFARSSWMYDLARRWDGGFSYDCINGQGSTGANNFKNFPMSTSAILTYALPLRQLYVTGRTPDTSRWLTSNDVAEAVFADDYVASSRTTSNLVCDLGSWSHKVRILAAQELGVRTNENVALLPTLTAMANETNGFARLGACLALGRIGQVSSAPVLAALLTNSNSDVRFQAAGGMKYLPTSVSRSVLNSILTAVVANGKQFSALDEDPMQLTHARLSGMLFGVGGVIYAQVDGVDKGYLYPAIRSVAATPQGSSRSSLAYTYPKLSLTDVQAVADAIVDSIQYRAQADKMFSGGVRDAGLAVLEKYRIAEAVPLSLIYAFEKDSSAESRACSTLAIFAGSSLLVQPSPGDIRSILTKWKNDNAVPTEAQAALDAIAADTNPTPATPFKSIQSVTPNASSVTLPANQTVLRVSAMDYARGDSVFTWRKVSGVGDVTFIPNGTADSTNTTVVFSGTPGHYQFEVKMSDSRGLTEVSQTVNVTLLNSSGNLPSNLPPVANPQNISVPQQTTIPITLTGSDPEASALTYALVSQPAHGTLSGSAPNLFYFSDVSYTGPDSFMFQVMDPDGQVSNATVNITVTPTASFPVAIYEPFNYPTGSLHNATGSTEVGLSGSWSSTNKFSVTAGSLGYGQLATNGNFIYYNSSSILNGSRSIKNTALAANGLLNDGATLWFSVEVGMSNYASNVRLALALANSSFSNTTYNIKNKGAQLGCGIGLTYGSLPAGNYTVAATQFRDPSTGGGSTGNVFGAQSGPMYTYYVGEYGLLVGKITWGATSNDFDTIELYQLDTDLRLPDAPISTLSVKVDQTQFDTLAIAANNTPQMDEIRFGPSFSSVLWGNTAMTDVTPPVLCRANIVDNQAGGPVGQGIPVTYTVTFSEDIDAATVSAADFGNAGTAAITFGTITEPAPGVFSVPVTPTTTGTLQLKVVAGATIADVASNSLNTATAILDDTIITVIPAVTVPNVVGLAQATAQTNIVAATLVVGTINYQTNSAVAMGNVMSQSPISGASAALGSAVNLVVSLGATNQSLITSQPSATVVCGGGTAQLSVAASCGGTINYQWQKNSANLSDSGHYNGVTANVLTISNADSNDAANYRCVVLSSCGGTISSNATLTISSPVLSVSPASLSLGYAAIGSTAYSSFTVSNSGCGTLNVTASTSGAFGLGATAFSLSAGSATNLTVSFTPSAAGAASANVSFAGNGGSSTNAVSGTGAVPPVAGFSASAVAGYAPLTVLFADTSTGTITNRYWEFGDGATLVSLAKHVTHAFMGVGSNTVRLVASGPSGSSTAQLVVATIQLPPLLEYYWDSSVTDTAWGNAANWFNAGPPISSTDGAAFTSAVYNAQPNFAVSASLGSLRQAGSGALTIVGSTLTMFGVDMGGGNTGIHMEQGAGALTFSNIIVLGASHTWLNDSTGWLTASNVNANSKNLTIDGTGNVRLLVTSGVGTLTMSSTGTLAVHSIAGFTSGWQVNSGTLVFMGTYAPNGTIIGGTDAPATVIMSNAPAYLNYNVPNSKVTVDRNGRFYVLKASAAWLNFTSTGQSLTLTNGGRFYLNPLCSFSVTGTGSKFNVIGGDDGMSVADLGQAAIYIGGSFGNGGPTPGAGGSAIIDGSGQGAQVTNTGFFAVGGWTGSSLMITNGGQLFTGNYTGSTAVYSNSYVGYSDRNGYTSVVSSATIGSTNATANSVWNNNGRTLFVGYAGGTLTTSVATGNVLQVNMGGLLTNTALVVGRLTGSALCAGNRVILNGGRACLSSLMATTANNWVTFNAGTLCATTITYNNGTDFVVGDGAQAANLSLTGNGTFQNALTVANGSSLTGTGTVQATGGVQILDGGILEPGNPNGALAINGGDLVLSNGAVLNVHIGAYTNRISVTGNLTAGGTLNVLDAGWYAPGTITLITYTGALTYNGITVNNPLPGGYTGSISTNTAGQINLIVSAVGSPTAAPTGLSAMAGDAQVELSWNAVSGAVNYNVKRATVNGGPYTIIQTQVDTNFTDTSAINATTYYYVVSANNSGGQSGDSTQVSATPVVTSLAAPTGLSATGSNAQVSLNWNAVAYATNYNVKRATVNGGPYTTIQSQAGTSFNDATVVNGTTYYYVVSASTGAIVSPNSTQASATPQVPAPVAPTGLAATAGNAQVGLMWNASNGATSYSVKRATTSGGPYTTIQTPAGTSYNDTGVSNGTTYYYVVSASNAGGESANSTQASATPVAPSLFYWDKSALDTNWNNSANWFNAGIPTNANAIAAFTNGTYAALPALTNNVTIGRFWQSGSGAVTLFGVGKALTLSGYSVNGTNVGVQMDSGAGALAFTNNITLGANQFWLNGSTNELVSANVNANGKNLIIADAGNIRLLVTSGAGTLTMNGTGTLTLLSAAGFTSGLIVNSGTVVLNSGNGFNAGGAYIGGAGAPATVVATNNTYFSYNPPNTKVIVDNQGLLSVRSPSITMVSSGQSLTITNGGSFVTVSNHVFYVFGSNNNGLAVVGGSAGQALVNFNGGSLNIGMTSNGGNVGTNSWLLINGMGKGGLVTNIGFFAVGGNIAANQRTYNNSVIITNGGQLFTGYGFNTAINSNSYIGYNSNNTGLTNQNNSVTLVGNNGSTNSLWNNNGRIVYVGYSDAATGVCTGNVLRVVTGGVLTNTRLVVGSSFGLNTDNRVILDGGSIFVSSLVATNGSSNKVLFNAGTLSATGITYSNGVTLVVGDGTQAATLKLTGGTHRFQAGLTIANNGVFSGTGTVNGAVTVLDGGALSPGNGTIGTVTITGGDLVLGNSAVLNFDLGTASDLVACGNLTAAGILNVTAAGGFAPGTYTLFTYTGALTDNGITVNNPLPGGNTGTMDTSLAGQVRLVVSPATTTYTLTYTAGANGTISGTTPQTVNAGGSATAVTAVPSTGYHFVNWSDSNTANPRIDANVTANLSVTANFAINTYTLTYTAGANGTLTGTTPQTVNHGASGTAITAVPATGYHFVNWSDSSTANPRTDANITGNLSVTANFAINTYTLTYTAGANGALTGTTPQTVNHGANGSAITALPATGYHFVNWSDSSTANPRTDANITGNLSVTANFAVNTYTLTYTAGANGTLTGTTPQTVNHGANGSAITALPVTGYHFVNWSDSSTANPRTDANITGNLSVTATFAINTYTLTYTAGTNGTLTGTTPQTVNHGASGSAITAVPATGYHFVNWSDSSTVNPRTDANITGNLSVTANFALNTYTLTYTAGTNGTLTGTTPQTVNHGASGSAITAVPATGYHFVDWSDSSTANPRADANVTNDLSVTANYAINTYTLTYNAGTNGTLSGATTQTVNYAASGSAIMAVPATGYHFVNWSDSNTANPRTDANVTADMSVTANFAINTYTLTYTAGANGTLTGTTPQTVNHGASGSAITAMPATGYHFVNWSDSSTVNPRTDANITGNLSVTANFAINTYTLNYTAGANGTLTGTTPQTVNHGASGSAVTAVPNAGCAFVSWSDSSTTNPRADSNVTVDISVVASFAILPPTGLSATASNAQVALTWSAHPAATSYKLKRSTVSGGPYTTIQTQASTSFTDTGLSNGTTYYYVVSASNAGGESADSSQATATPIAPPAAPATLSATASNAVVSLSWNASSGATSYKVKRATVNGGPYAAIQTQAGTNYSDTAVSNGTTYYYVVSASNAGGEGVNSAQASATPVAPPAIPTGLSAVGSNTVVQLNWSVASGATSYLVKRATVSGGPYATIQTQAGPSYNDTGVSNGTTYYYVVSARNAGGESGNSTQATATPWAIPSPWTGVNIGTVGVAGSANESAGTWTLNGAGLGVQGTADSLYYVYQSGSGDCSIQSRVVSLQVVTTNAQSGVAIRDTLNVGSREMAVSRVSSNRVVCWWRTSNNGAVSQAQATGVTVPVWTRIVRTGSSFVGSYSTNGTTWTTLRTQTISMGTGVNIGLATSSGLTNVTATATNSNVTAVP